jgi:hypothetical protein
MKKILMAITLLISMASCEHDYPEEVTYTGSNTHGFKLNGEKWVRENTGFVPSRCIYEQTKELIGINLYSVAEKSTDSQNAAIRFTLQKNKNHFKESLNFDFKDLNDSIINRIISSGELDTTKCYCKIDYWDSNGKHLEYSNVISGNLQLLRFDSLFVGTFDLKLTNGTDTITLTDGKFDYKITID